MRKRVINHVADTIFWYILYFLPVLAYLFFVISAPARYISMLDSSNSSQYEEVIEEEMESNSSAVAASLSVDYPGFVPLSEMTEAQAVEAEAQAVKLVVFPSTLNAATSSPLVSGDDTSITFWFSYKQGTSTKYYYYNTLFLARNQFAINYPNFGYTTMLCYNYSGTTITLEAPYAFFLPYDMPEITACYSYVNNDTSLARPFAESDLLSYFIILDGYYVGTSLPGSDTPETETPSNSIGITYDFKDFVNEMGFEFATDNIIVNSLSDIFGSDGIMPLFDNDTPFIIFAWFIGVYLLHLLVDFLLFIPRIAHKWMKDCTGGD